MIYRSKVDPWPPTVLILLFGLYFAIGLIILIGAGAPRSPGLARPHGRPGGPAAGPATGRLADDLRPRATRSDGEPILLVRGGLLLRYEIPIAGISEVRPSKSVLSSPAWSYDRIEVISRSPEGVRRLHADFAAGPRRFPGRPGPPRRRPRASGRSADA